MKAPAAAAVVGSASDTQLHELKKRNDELEDEVNSVYCTSYEGFCVALCHHSMIKGFMVSWMYLGIISQPTEDICSFVLLLPCGRVCLIQSRTLLCRWLFFENHFFFQY